MEHILKIATVDDIAAERENLAENIKEYMDSRLLKYKILHYENGESFVEALKEECFDIVFMDIYMDGMTGIEAAAKLRENSMDCKLVFLTSSTDFLAQGYAYNPCHYLLKPFDAEKFEQAMHNCQIRRQLEVPFLNVVSEGVSIRIDTTKLMYIDIHKRSTTLHMTDKILAVSGSMGKVIAPLLGDQRFLQCIQGVLVNMDYIVDVEAFCFLLENGELLQMTMRNRKRLVKQYHAYQFQRVSSRGGTYL